MSIPRHAFPHSNRALEIWRPSPTPRAQAKQRRLGSRYHRIWKSPSGHRSRSIRQQAWIHRHPAEIQHELESPTHTGFSSAICSPGLSSYTTSYLLLGICRSVSWGWSTTRCS
ncbi:hypothetical protein D1007_16941 [Hordeum vulgare]|nr:hypothetical protein D1007_16941 [Hordeum vulgare]